MAALRGGCSIVTDTNSGISVAEGRELGVFVLPMPLLVDGEIRYEGVDLTPEEFYAAQLAGREVSTSQPSPGDVMDLRDRVLEEYDALVYIPMSSGLSGSCQSALMLAADYDGKVQVVNNQRISVTQRQSALDALALAEKGMDAAQIRQFLEEDKFNSSIYIMLDTLYYLKKGGRITPAAALLGSVLGIKPILTIQGEKLDTFSKARSMRRCKTKMIEALKKDYEERFSMFDWSELCVGAAGTRLSQAEIDEWTAMLQEAFPKTVVRYAPLSLSIGTHTGPGVVGCAICLK